MPLQTSGPISLGDIHVEAAGSIYAGTGESSLNDEDIRGLTPASGYTINSTLGTTISIGDFYGARKIQEGLSDSLDSISGTSNAWSTRTVDISAYAGLFVRIVFGYTNGTQGTTYQGDIQLDDIRLDGTTYSFENNGHSWQTTTSDTQIANYSTASFSTLTVGTTTNRWNVDSGGTPSGSTGRTDADAGSYYVYAETSSSAAGRGYVLRSPSVNLSSSPTLSYAVARHGNNIGTLNVYIEVLGSSSSSGGSSSGTWQQTLVSGSSSYRGILQTAKPSTGWTAQSYGNNGAITDDTFDPIASQNIASSSTVSTPAIIRDLFTKADSTQTFFRIWAVTEPTDSGWTTIRCQGTGSDTTDNTLNRTDGNAFYNSSQGYRQYRWGTSSSPVVFIPAYSTTYTITAA